MLLKYVETMFYDSIILPGIIVFMLNMAWSFTQQLATGHGHLLSKKYRREIEYLLK